MLAHARQPKVSDTLLLSYGGWVVPLSADGMKMTLEFSNLPHGNRSAGDVAQGSYVFIQFDVLLKACVIFSWYSNAILTGGAIF
jgi:hypothetical protein